MAIRQMISKSLLAGWPKMILKPMSVKGLTYLDMIFYFIGKDNFFNP